MPGVGHTTEGVMPHLCPRGYRPRATVHTTYSTRTYNVYCCKLVKIKFSTFCRFEIAHKLQ